MDLIQLRIWIIGITHLMMDASRSFDFLTYHTSDSILGHISFSIEICRSPWIRMIIPSYEMHIVLRIRFHFFLDSPLKPSFSHSVKLILSDIVMNFRWIYLRCVDSHIIISGE